LPRGGPRVTGVEFAVHYEPAFDVGGDFYDYLWLGPSRLGLVIGDVSGKAVSGALFMARVTSEFRAAATLEHDPRRLMQRVNRAVAQVAEDGMFCTALLVAIELETHLARVVNAGHPVPLLRREGAVALIDDARARALPLGVQPGLDVGEVEVELRPGDALLLCTDGLLEACAGNGAFYGTDRLAGIFARAGDGARGVVEAALGDIDRFVQGVAQTDDQTLLCLEVSAARSRRCTSDFPRGLVPGRR
jgi:sigma-B regulation protein RsbU (phosphoserine phosphatase)